MKIIDSHIHLSHIYSFQQHAKHISHVDYSIQGLLGEMKENQVAISIGMGLREIEGGEGFPDSSPTTPMGLDMLLKENRYVFQCVGINPYRLGPHERSQLEKALLKPDVVGMKIYLGDYPFYAHDKVYDPIYDLAKDYRLPVIFQTGQTYTRKGHLKYAHPISIDEVARSHQDVTFVLAHLGVPLLHDAMAVMRNNDHVYASMSSFVSGNANRVRERVYSKDFINFFRQAFALCDLYDRFMFASNWPYVPMTPYIELIKEIIPPAQWENVFYRNALEVFPKIKSELSLL